MVDVNECLTNPCGANAVCTDSVGSYTCTCQTGCVGDPKKGCLCTTSSTVGNPCDNIKCGTNALCRIEPGTDKPVCYCPSNYPGGDPRVSCKLHYIRQKKKIPFINLNLVKGVIERPSSRGDCRANGCGTGANCLAQGDVFVCRCSAGLKGDPEVKCTPGTILKIKINPNNIS